MSRRRRRPPRRRGDGDRRGRTRFDLRDDEVTASDGIGVGVGSGSARVGVGVGAALVSVSVRESRLVSVSVDRAGSRCRRGAWFRCRCVAWCRRRCLARESGVGVALGFGVGVASGRCPVLASASVSGVGVGARCRRRCLRSGSVSVSVSARRLGRSVRRVFRSRLLPSGAMRLNCFGAAPPLVGEGADVGVALGAGDANQNVPSFDQKPARPLRSTPGISSDLGGAVRAGAGVCSMRVLRLALPSAQEAPGSSRSRESALSSRVTARWSRRSSRRA